MVIIHWLKRNYVNVNFMVGLALCGASILLDNKIINGILQLYLVIELLVMLLIFYEKIFVKRDTIHFIMSLIKSITVLLFSILKLLMTYCNIEINTKIFLIISAVFCFANAFIGFKKSRK